LNGSGRSVAYLALFSEIGFIFLVTTLAGALGGHWLDDQLGTNPILVILGMLIGFGIGGVGVYRTIVRFLAKLEN
jgi:F0F1-type ATP synthase assembly protein I